MQILVVACHNRWALLIVGEVITLKSQNISSQKQHSLYQEYGKLIQILFSNLTNIYDSLFQMEKKDISNARKKRKDLDTPSITFLCCHDIYPHPLS